MNRGFFASFLVITAAAGLGYWLCCDSALQPRPTLKLKEAIRTAPFVADQNGQEPERFTAGPFVETIDLSTNYDPTGEELALQTLLGSIVDVPEVLGTPRTLDLEMLPQPQQISPEPLPQPRLAATDPLSDAGEEASSPPPSQFEILRRRASMMLAEKFAEILSEMEPLKGGAPAPVEDEDDM